MVRFILQIPDVQKWMLWLGNPYALDYLEVWKKNYLKVKQKQLDPTVWQGNCTVSYNFNITCQTAHRSFKQGRRTVVKIGR